MRRIVPTPILLVLVGAMVQAAAPDPGAGQGAEGREIFLLKGIVLDHATDEPVQGVRIRLTELGLDRVTDDRGEFSILELPGGDHTFVATRFGYRPSEETSRIEDNVVLIIRLEPDPVILEALEVSVAREELREAMDRRVRSAGFSSRRVDREDLLTSTAADPLQLLQDRFGIARMACPGDTGGDRNCLMSRGRASRPSVFIDEVRQPRNFGGVGYLSPADLYRVEYFPAPLNQLRFYTVHYGDWLARSGGRLPPLCIVC